MNSFLLNKFLWCAICLLGFFASAAGAADTYINPGAPTTVNEIPQFEPGVFIVLPDGQTAIIEQALPNGDLRTNLGQVISPLGIIQEGPDKGYQVTLDPTHYPALNGASNAENNVTIQMPTPPQATTPQNPMLKSPDIPKTPVVDNKSPTIKTPAIPAQQKTSVKPDSPKPQVALKDLTLAELLPMTPATQTAQTKPQTSATSGEKTRPQPKKEASVKTQPEKAPSKTPAKAESTKPESTKPAAVKKPASGQALRIPPESIKTGNLDFLEGCWEGTRPEYVSKRTVKECFCFNKGGKTGKRRIFDSAFNRQCIGASRANMSSSGVLSVTSDRMACSDGENWGGAEMVCKNSGPRTPCSWIFTDANNGRQAYEIPFVRVESCRR